MGDARLSIYKDAYRRADLQGVRVVAALNIAICHIWIHKVSGGVDVFFVLSGLFLTASLLRAHALEGRWIAPRFWWRVVTRIMPMVLLVVAVTGAATIAFIPPPMWKFGANELIAALLNVENIELIRVSADYLDRQSPPSPFQQFWAIGVQFQIYALLPLIALIGVGIGRWRWLGKLRGPKAITAYFLLLSVMGFAYAVIAAGVDQAGAYFSPLTRFWQFAVGGALAAAYPLLRSHRGWRGAPYFYAIGVLLMVLGGLLLPAHAPFPGWPALLPVSGVALVILCGADDHMGWAKAGLASRPMVYLSRFTFGFYLWHWPLLIMAQYHWGDMGISLWLGLVIIVAAGVMAAFSHHWIEAPAIVALRKSGRAIVIFLLCCALMLGVALGARGMLLHLAAVPRAVVVRPQPYRVVADAPVKLSLSAWATLNYDRASEGTRCRNMVCRFNMDASGPTYFLYGSSHAAQWTDVLLNLAQRRNARLVTAIDLNDYAAEIARVRPSLVITIGSLTDQRVTGVKEAVVTDQFELWRDLARQGIPVIAIRDNHRFSTQQNACLWRQADRPQHCAIPRASVYADRYPVLDVAFPANVHPVDLTDLYCTADLCPAAINGVPVFYDKHHFTASFLSQIGQEVQDRLAPVIAQLEER